MRRCSVSLLEEALMCEHTECGQGGCNVESNFVASMDGGELRFIIASTIILGSPPALLHRIAVMDGADLCHSSARLKTSSDVWWNMNTMARCGLVVGSTSNGTVLGCLLRESSIHCSLGERKRRQL